MLVLVLIGSGFIRAQTALGPGLRKLGEQHTIGSIEAATYIDARIGLEEVFNNVVPDSVLIMQETTGLCREHHYRDGEAEAGRIKGNALENKRAYEAALACYEAAYALFRARKQNSLLHYHLKLRI